MSGPRLLTTYDVFDYELVTNVVRPHTVTEDARGNVSDVPEVEEVFLKGVIQKADVLNQNGRVYPKAILEREVRNYQKFIIESRALGECVPPGTEIYTRDGWKRIEEIADDEAIVTLNVATGAVEVQAIDRKVVLPYEGELYHFKNAETLDMCLTPNHRVLAWDRNCQPVTVLARDLHDAVVNPSSPHRWLTMCEIRYANDDMQSSHNVSLDFRFLQHESTWYKGNVYCVTVQNGTWLMRRNGKVCWTHNCDHPDSSVISLKNVSHIFTEVYMQDGIVYGTTKLLDTPSGQILKSLVKSKVKLGISSRGVGSTKKQGDYQVVQDDFQLICWDYVSEPSTSGAFMLPEGKVIKESDAHECFHEYFTKSDRIDRIVNDILTTKGMR